MSCLAVGLVEGPKEREYGSYRMQKRTTKKWREDWLGEIMKTREVDRDFKRQLCLHAIPTIFYMDEGC